MRGSESFSEKVCFTGAWSRGGQRIASKQTGPRPLGPWRSQACPAIAFLQRCHLKEELSKISTLILSTSHLQHKHLIKMRSDGHPLHPTLSHLNKIGRIVVIKSWQAISVSQITMIGASNNALRGTWGRQSLGICLIYL